MNEQQTPSISDPPLEVADISELLKGSMAAPFQPHDFVKGDPLDELYRQAVAAAKEYGWPVPARGEFEERYRREIAASREKQE